MKEYRLQFLNDKEFENLSRINPRYTNTKDDFGFADMKTDRIFVRKTGVPILDQFVTAHEIEEILSKYSKHEDEFAIRHKKGRDIFGTIAPIAAAFIPGIGPVLSAAMAGGYTGYKVSKGEAQPWQIPVNAGLSFLGGKLAQGGAGYKAGVESSKQAGGGMFGQTMRGIKGSFGIGAAPQYGAGTPTGTVNTGTFSKFPQGYVSSGGNFPTTTAAMRVPTGFAATNAGAIPAAQYLGYQAPNSTISSTGQAPVVTGPGGVPITSATGQGEALPNYASNLGFQAPTTANVPMTSITQAAAAPATQVGGEIAGQTASRTPMLEKLLGKNWQQTVLGASVPLVGSKMFGAQATAEPFSPDQSALFNETANMIRQGAQVQLTPAQTQAITAQYDTALEQARQNILDRYKALRPGSDIENDSNLREALTELETEMATQKANALASAQLGLSQQQTQMMSELAAMDIYTLSMKAGISYQEAAEFKRMLSDMGYMLATSGRPIMYSNTQGR